MTKSASFLLCSLLAMSLAACNNVAKTSSDAPNSTASAPESVNEPTAQTNQDDATNDIRRKQLNSDIRAREQRNNAVGDPNDRADGDLESEIRSKLEANLPASELAVAAKDGAVTVTGSVVDEGQLQKIEPLAREIKGVQSVTVNAAVAVATPDQAPSPNSDVPIKSQTNSSN